MKVTASLTRIITWSALFLFSQSLFGQGNKNSQDYHRVFGKDYENALRIVQEREWWVDSLEKEGIDPHFALSIVFPELIRYSSIEDYIQVKALEVLYVQYGREYSDFSIGFFQMKPSFAEMIESDLLKYQIAETFPALLYLNPDTANDIESRKQRILRLKDERFQILYLEAFIRIMAKIYPELENSAPAEKLIFYSAAYNAGYFKNETVIRQEINRKRFFTGMIPGQEKYSYTAIALSFYMEK